MNGLELTVERPADVAPSRGRPEVFRSTKSYGHSEGLSCCFRQWRADHSHCRFIHGYALAFRFVFGATHLDDRNWCVDFGDLKQVKSFLHDTFDHTMLVAADDPELARFEALEREGLLVLRVLPSVGCEATARYVFEQVDAVIVARTNARAWVESVEVSEHAGNSAIYSRER